MFILPWLKFFELSKDLYCLLSVRIVCRLSPHLYSDINLNIKKCLIRLQKMSKSFVYTQHISMTTIHLCGQLLIIHIFVTKKSSLNYTICYYLKILVDTFPNRVIRFLCLVCISVFICNIFFFSFQKLRILQNFNTLMSVVGGLTHSALARLSKTNACIPSETQKVIYCIVYHYR